MQMLEMIDKTVNPTMTVLPGFKMLVANVEDFFFKSPPVSQTIPEGALDEVAEGSAST